MARGNKPNPLRLSVVLLEEYPIGLLAGGAFAPHGRFAAGKTSAQAEFTSAEHLNHRRAEAAFGCRSPKRKDFRIGSPFSLVREAGLEPARP